MTDSEMIAAEVITFERLRAAVDILRKDGWRYTFHAANENQAAAMREHLGPDPTYRVVIDPQFPTAVVPKSSRKPYEALRGSRW